MTKDMCGENFTERGGEAYKTLTQTGNQPSLRSFICKKNGRQDRCETERKERLGLFYTRL